MGTLGIAFFAATDYVTALIPSVFGVMIAGFGIGSMAYPKVSSKSIQMSYFISSVAVTIGLTTAMFGSWVTTTSLIEQLMMTAIGGGHLFAGYSTYTRTTEENPTEGTLSSVRDNIAVASKSVKELYTPEEKIIPAAVFALVTD